MDGYIARADRSPPNQERYGGWTSQQDKRILIDQMTAATTLIVGRVTWEQMWRVTKPGLAWRTKDKLIVTRNGVSPRLLSEIAVPPDLARIKRILLRAPHPARPLVMGGSLTYSLLAPIVDKWIVVVEPVLLGGGVRMLDLADEVRLRLTSWEALNDRGTMLFEWAPRR
jgi:dihydrofolate reductase